MDMKRNRRLQPWPRSSSDRGSVGGASRPASERKTGGILLRLAMILVAILVFIPLMPIVSRSKRNPLRPAAESGHFDVNADLEEEFIESSKSQKAEVDKFLGGLLASGIEEQSCLSRYQSVLYRKASSRSPSPYLLKRLRKYEELHKKCGPNSDLYNRTVNQLKPGQSSSGITECNYVVWISYSGLGNRILTLASTFLYALLTNRVLLIDRGVDMTVLFCEPFPWSSWLLPLDFPVSQFKSFDINSPESYGNMLKNRVISKGLAGALLPSYMYLHLGHDYGEHDKLFFCEDDQNLLQKIPWLVLRSDNYFAPSLFLIPSYEGELHQLFPERDTVFHHLGRYLLHPSNSVWGLITRYYHAYLSKADEKLGIQIRVFESESGPFQHVLDQVLACTIKQSILPEISKNESMIITAADHRSKAVLITSLSTGYFKMIRNMYWEHPSKTGDIIGVYQPSHEEHQQTEKQIHNMKAWAEMYLLSLTDVLVTSAWSTFGYVAQGLGGLKPWILVKPENRTVPNPPCLLAMSMEPCFHAPPFYDCRTKRGVDTGALVPHVTHCEDMSWGLKLVDRDEW
uniref:Fucosyltransferase n=1 Tax=Apostasia odorata TaxID=280455 RepID=A0A1S6YFT1_9ASPA|nr:galactoside 2-alpha-L-fucosyltransferase-like protein [Apostasia odorata]